MTEKLFTGTLNQNQNKTKNIPKMRTHLKKKILIPICPSFSSSILFCLSFLYLHNFCTQPFRTGSNVIDLAVERIYSLVKFCLFILQILSGNTIVTSLRSRYCITNLRKMVHNNLPGSCQYWCKFIDQISSIYFQDHRAETKLKDWNYGITEGQSQGKSSISPTLSKRGYNNEYISL